MEQLTKLLNLDVSKLTEKKGKLTYLSWAHAWKEFLKIYPDATYTVKKNDDGTPMFGNAKFGYMVYTEVTAGGITREMWLFVMDGANKSMKDDLYTYQVNEYTWPKGKKTFKCKVDKTVEEISMFDINKTVMRCLVKNLAMFGLGLYIYACEDLPEIDDDTPPPKVDKKETTKPVVNKESGNEVDPITITAPQLIEMAKLKHVPLQQLLDMYEKDVKKTDDVKFFKQEYKLKYYNMLDEMKVK